MRLPENPEYGSQNIVKSAAEYQERKQRQFTIRNAFSLLDYFKQQKWTRVNHIVGRLPP